MRTCTRIVDNVQYVHTTQTFIDDAALQLSDGLLQLIGTYPQGTGECFVRPTGSGLIVRVKGHSTAGVSQHTKHGDEAREMRELEL